MQSSATITVSVKAGQKPLDVRINCLRNSRCGHSTKLNMDCKLSQERVTTVCMFLCQDVWLHARQRSFGVKGI